MPREEAARAKSSMCRIRYRSSSLRAGTKPRTALGAGSIERAIVLQLVQQVSHNINIVGSNDETRLIWPLFA